MCYKGYIGFRVPHLYPFGFAQGFCRFRCIAVPWQGHAFDEVSENMSSEKWKLDFQYFRACTPENGIPCFAELCLKSLAPTYPQPQLTPNPLSLNPKPGPQGSLLWLFFNTQKLHLDYSVPNIGTVYPKPAGMGDWATGAYFTHSGSLKYHDDDEDPVRFRMGVRGWFKVFCFQRSTL